MCNNFPLELAINNPIISLCSRQSELLIARKIVPVGIATGAGDHFESKGREGRGKLCFIAAIGPLPIDGNNFCHLSKQLAHYKVEKAHSTHSLLANLEPTRGAPKECNTTTTTATSRRRRRGVDWGSNWLSSLRVVLGLYGACKTC